MQFSSEPSSRFVLAAPPAATGLVRPKTAPCLSSSASAPSLSHLIGRKLQTQEFLTPNLLKSAAAVVPAADLLAIGANRSTQAQFAQFRPDRALRASRQRAAKALHRGQPSFSLLDHATAGAHLVLEATQPSHWTSTAVRPAAALAVAEQPDAQDAQAAEVAEAAAGNAVKLATRI